MSTVPYGAIAGFLLPADIREVAAHYGVRSKMLRRRDGRTDPRIAEARAALYWKLTRKRGMSPERVGQLLRVTGEAVRKGAEAHARRIDEYRATAGALNRDDDDAPADRGRA
jgi:hypothetical protein